MILFVRPCKIVRMKKIGSLTTLLLTVIVSHAQLAQTKWKGSVLAPNAMEAWLHFKNDTLDVFVSNGNSLLETMTYTLVSDTMLLKKVSGRSPCDVNVTGKYKWSLNGQTLLITPVADDCEDRYRAWTGQPFIRRED